TTPRTSTLFPYTTLFRSKRKLSFILNKNTDGIRRKRNKNAEKHRLFKKCIHLSLPLLFPCLMTACVTRPETAITATVETTVMTRSEEHTSELQSRFDLVC